MSGVGEKVTESVDGVQTITVLGSTGSIGRSTLAVLSENPDSFRVFALTAYRDADTLLAQCRQWQPQFAVLCEQPAAASLRESLRQHCPKTELLVGRDALSNVASDPGVDTVMAAIVGAAGLDATLAAVQAGKKVLLANKEALVMAGAFMLDAVSVSGACLLPIDSEHNAIFQCLPEAPGARSLSDMGVDKLLLTGSGGPFLERDISTFGEITVSEACAHPNWSMGDKISVDSATMMNKGLELIEACWLFDCSPDMIDIVIHPQSVIHSMVEYSDGSVLAQMGRPDMRTPIAHALAWPSRMPSGVEKIHWSSLSGLTFRAPDSERFPALRIAQHVARQRGGTAVVLNAANEIAVDEFLHQRITYLDIVAVVEACLEKLPEMEPDSIEAIQALDCEARALAGQLCASRRVVHAAVGIDH